MTNEETNCEGLGTLQTGRHGIVNEKPEHKAQCKCYIERLAWRKHIKMHGQTRIFRH